MLFISAIPLAYIFIRHGHYDHIMLQVMTPRSHTASAARVFLQKGTVFHWGLAGFVACVIGIKHVNVVFLML
jgi:L-ascorbate metabolism protein UlaG (beta-lactamase superfamily)